MTEEPVSRAPAQARFSAALVELGHTLANEGYQFITPTPETHRRVVARRGQARGLRDVFGWSLPFSRSLLPAPIVELLRASDALIEAGNELRSRVRFSSLGASLFVHSAYPTDARDAVFFGPDTYRFCSFIRRAAPAARSVVDIGCGSGAGGLIAAQQSGATRLVLADVNEVALAYAGVNVALSRCAGVTSSELNVQTPSSDVLAGVDGELDLIVANPPYMRDDAARAYRDGGGAFGEALSVRIVRESLARLTPGGALLLYTGVAIVDARDVFRDAIDELLNGYSYQYEELDPDVFGEQLDEPGYENVERIAAIGLTVRRLA
jgi:release factor glutamine methyltransferase